MWCDFFNVRFVMGPKCVMGSVGVLLPSHRPFLVILQPPRSPPDLAKKTHSDMAVPGEMLETHHLTQHCYFSVEVLPV